jgi:polyhydroxybutyrate depolymerase
MRPIPKTSLKPAATLMRPIATLPLLLFLCLLVVGCTTGLPQGTGIGPRTFKNTVDIEINGFRRTYLVHVPTGYTPDIPLPLVVVIHGAFDTAQGMERVSGFSLLADREGFIVLYPNGMGILGFLQHWNAGHCCGKAADDQVDDVGFVAATIEDVCSRLRVDRDRIYMVGFSNGGMLAYRFAAERGDLLAAVAPMAASIGGRPSQDLPEWRIPEPVQPVSMIPMHGLLDDDVPYEGGISRHRGGTRTYWSVEQSVEFWVAANGCKSPPVIQNLYDGKVVLKDWKNCTNKTEVSLHLINGWGHVWPGSSFTAALAADDPFQHFDAAEVLWAFFKSQRRQADGLRSK